MYIDPSSGGLLVQVLLIAFGAISGVILVFSGKIKMGFARLIRSLRDRSNHKVHFSGNPKKENIDKH